MTQRERRTSKHLNNPHALILSGGGARGAYEAGVISYIYGELGVRTPRGIFGTSVGGVNGAFLAASVHDPSEGSRALNALWAHLELPRLIGFGLRQLAGLRRVVVGSRSTPVSLFDVAPMIALVTEAVAWRTIHTNLRSGLLDVLCVSATEVHSGKPTLFVDRAPGVLALPAGFQANMVVLPSLIGPRHVLASAAIPLVFPSVKIGHHYYCDGGLRQNTPIAPAVHTGFSKLLIVGVSNEGVASSSNKAEEVSQGSGGTAFSATGRGDVTTENTLPGATFLLGKVLNAFMLDHLNSDLVVLDRMNQMLRDGAAIYGEDFLTKMNAVAAERHEPAKKIVERLVLKPSLDLGVLASEYVKRQKAHFGKLFGGGFMRLLDIGAGGDADLASYLLFDGDYARMLMDLGRRDAKARRDEILTFLSEE